MSEIKPEKQNNNNYTVKFGIIACVVLVLFVSVVVMMAKNSQPETANIAITSTDSESGEVKHNTVQVNTDEHIDIQSTGDVAEQVTDKKLPELHIVDGELRNYESINTKFFVINSDKGESHISEGNLSLDLIVSTVNDYLKESRDMVVGVGVIGSHIFIQQDTREQRNNQRLNIVTFETAIDADDFIELTESIHNTHRVTAQSLFNYETNTGSRHLIYVFNDKEDQEPVERLDILPENPETVTPESEAVVTE